MYARTHAHTYIQTCVFIHTQRQTYLPSAAHKNTYEHKHLHTYAYIYIYKCPVCMQLDTYPHIRKKIYPHKYLCADTEICKNMSYIYIYIYIYIYADIQKCSRIFTYIHTHICTYTPRGIDRSINKQRYTIYSHKTPKHIYIHMHILIEMNASRCENAYTYVHAQKKVCIYIYINLLWNSRGISVHAFEFS